MIFTFLRDLFYFTSIQLKTNSSAVASSHVHEKNNNFYLVHFHVDLQKLQGVSKVSMYCIENPGDCVFQHHVGYVFISGCWWTSTSQ